MRSVLMTGILVSTALRAEPAVKWQPTGKWTVEHADRQCLASRTFVRDGQSLTVVLAPTPANDSGELWVLTDDPRLALARSDRDRARRD
ncbi:hypothetical protein [uncultured Sphingomonas sp.]|uniref:hypothetical protein n=1 Tax=uncultured Sphingomonas sp. TaxID=158754 RepID=UPI0025CF84F8|nr:hypothetical protein [uncultured Sphingomonas sp.]